MKIETSLLLERSLRSETLVFAARWCRGASASAPRSYTRVMQVFGRVRSRGLGSGESGALRRVLGSVTNKPPRACPPPGSTICQASPSHGRLSLPEACRTIPH
ncbi:hypothetical protein E2C01_025437 [Portunus trituberculatus]|uniref:Uncharacterized protein n=1 Tax=Portunus trituberculatus TaxID=210409 RepID=A0A5B7EDC6_PORTR|nr:hypothetical protein [Portunus trituberculatus]